MDNKSPQTQQQPAAITKKRVFISYAREDRARIRQLAASLERDGVDVWWDIETPPGKRFVDVIAEALQSCDHVVVVWSTASVESEWVKREAATGLERGVLLPILFEHVDELPFLFRDLHACSLINWQGETEHREYRNLLEAIQATSPLPVTNKTPASVVKPLPVTPTPALKPATETETRSLVPLFFAGLLGLSGAGLAGFFLNQQEAPGTPTVTEPEIAPPGGIVVDTGDAPGNPPALPPAESTTAADQAAPQDQQDQNGFDYGQNQTTQDDKNTTDSINSTPGTVSTTNIASTPVTPSQTTATPYKVTAKPSLILRDQPQQAARKINSVPTNSTLYVTATHGSAMTINDKTGHWVAVRNPANGKTAYAFNAYLEAYTAYHVTAEPSLIVRDKPSQRARKMTALPKGMTIYPLATASGKQTIGDKSGTWVRIEHDGKTGYIFDAFLKENKVD